MCTRKHHLYWVQKEKEITFLYSVMKYEAPSMLSILKYFSLYCHRLWWKLETEQFYLHLSVLDQIGDNNTLYRLECKAAHCCFARKCLSKNLKATLAKLQELRFPRNFWNSKAVETVRILKSLKWWKHKDSRVVTISKPPQLHEYWSPLDCENFCTWG